MSAINRCDVAIVGAGVIGLALARELASSCPSRSVVVLEKEKRSGLGISGRSSEVIHAGLYYPKNYLKSRLCAAGREQLYRYCEARGIPHRRVGKMVVAQTDEEHEFLHALALRAELNGVNDLRWLRKRDWESLEPALQAKGAFLSPSTGIIDSRALMDCLERDSAGHNVTFAFHTEVNAISRCAQGFVVRGQSAGQPLHLHARLVINAAGLSALCLARTIENFPLATLPPQVLARGNYFAYAGHSPFRHLIYPVPFGQPMTSPGVQHQGLGIHATLDLQGQLRFGPDVQLVDSEDYRVDESRRTLFADTIRRYFPALDADRLQPAYAGIRPRLVVGDSKTPDFVIQAEDQHGLPGLVNLLGIESPGLTCCLSLAGHVVALLRGHLE